MQAQLEMLDMEALSQVMSVSIRTVKRWRSEGRLPEPVVLGPRCIRWSSDVIREWIAAGCKPKDDEPSA